MFSAFSFGKIIKTILPGSILTAALILLLDAFWELGRPDSDFLLGQIPKDWITPVTAALIPLSLLLGFFLNTFTWTALNRRMRIRCDKVLKATVYGDLRAKLAERLWNESEGRLGKLSRDLGTTSSSSGRPPLEYYYLPAVTLTNLNYLWESYFCWYEFDVNSACALALSIPAAGFLLWVKLPHCHPLLLMFMPVLLAITVIVYLLLTSAAVKNLVSYEKNLLLLILGSLEEPAEDSDLFVDWKIWGLGIGEGR